MSAVPRTVHKMRLSNLHHSIRNLISHPFKISTGLFIYFLHVKLEFNRMYREKLTFV
jgi:hypothetical protein